MARYSDLSSAELVKVCADSKDEAAWAEFIRRFHAVIASAVLRTARAWGEPSHALLDDLIQDVYLKLCDDGNRLLSSFQAHHDDAIYGFLKVVAANVVRDHFKSALAVKRGSDQTQPIEDPLEIEPRAGGIDSFDAVSQRIQLDRIDKIITQSIRGKELERNRTIFWLRHRQGLTAGEIAAIPFIGLTADGVETVLLRLTILIRSHLISSAPHREVKVLKRKNRSNR